MELRLFLVAALFVVSALAEPLREDLKQLDVAEASLNPADTKVEEVQLQDTKAEETQDAKAEETPDAEAEEVPKYDTRVEDVANSDSEAKKKNMHKSFKIVSADPHSSLAKTVIFCEGAKGMLRCPAGTKIVITAANYGRTAGPFVCPHSSIRTTHCKAQSSLQKVRKSCQKHASCALHASNSAFGDPCHGTYKYLQVSFICGI